MATKTLMSVEEYLRTTFDGSDREYLDGETVERNMGEWPHAQLQARLSALLIGIGTALGLQVVAEIRIQINPRRFRVADVAAWRPGDVGGRVPTVPPFLAIEILSAEDRLARMLPKIQEYLSLGVEWIWLIDPDEKTAVIYSRQNPAGAVTDVLRTENPPLELPLATVFAA